ncbi:hypothetical protein Cantr_09770 [Candida viswanathii]|uniref:Uncharacterized protein n=1 Tax=Candida viswanathii TaxID=5486 RepID=A0A367YCZ6_9ASCO|nr:hypothetical protein Cantr_09770 [Candida viswanathii]
MNNTINLESHTIDLSTLEELRDPNLISRYPPLFQRKQNLITLDHNCNINSSSGSIKRSKTVSTTNSKNVSLAPSISAPISNYYQIQPYSPSLASKEAPSNYGNKRHRFVKFLKNFSTKSSRPTRLELLKQSISKPIAQQSPVPTERLDHHASIFMNSLYPTKSRNSIEIKSDEDSETMCDARGGGGGGRIGAVKVEDEAEECYEETKEFDLSRRNTYLSQLKFQPMSPPQDFSAVNTIIIPPVGGSSQIINPEHYSSPIIHPNIHLDESGGTMGSNHRTNISFAKYDLMNLGPSAMSPIDDHDDHDDNDDDDDDDDDDMVEIDRTEFVLPNSSFFIPTTAINNASQGDTADDEGGAGAEEEEEDDNDSYYSFSKSPQDSNKLSIKSPAMRSNSSRIVASPIYRIIHNSPTEGRYY